MGYIDVCICQNDEMGRLDKAMMMDFSSPVDGETFLRIETVDLQPRECLCNDRIIEMYGVRIKHSGCSEWVGNIHWNLYKVPDYYAIGFINMLMRSRDWSCIEAWTEIFEKWAKHEPITGRDLELDEDVEGIVVNPDQLKIFNQARS